MLLEYVFIAKYFLLSLLISSVLFILSYLFIYQQPELEKISSYECGFNPFGDARNRFEVRFYLVGILFIIFDLEIIFLFPWIMTIFQCTLYGHFVMVLFLFLLTIGFYYEWVKGALDWD